MIDPEETLRDALAARLDPLTPFLQGGMNVPRTARRLVSDLRSDTLATEAADAVVAIMDGVVSLRWWSTPLGALVAAAATRGPGTVSVHDAAKMLGVHRSRVYQLVEAGRLVRSDHRGRLELASVLDELGACRPGRRLARKG